MALSCWKGRGAVRSKENPSAGRGLGARSRFMFRSAAQHLAARAAKAAAHGGDVKVELNDHAMTLIANIHDAKIKSF
jgi:hypothetical protein